MKKKNLRITIAGSGGVAEAFCRWIPSSGYEVAQVFARNEDRGKKLADLAGSRWTSDPEALESVDLFLIAVSDSAIREVAASLDPGDAVVAHTSGSCGLNELPTNIRKKGVFYPLQTFTPGLIFDYEKIPIFIEAENADTYEVLTSLASNLSESVYRSDSELRRKLHVAAVFVCNFVNDLYVTGESLMKASGLDFEVLKPLIEETTRKVLNNPSPLPLQTGPAVREDWPTIEKHMQMLERYPDLQTIYSLLTEHIIKMKQTHGEL